LNAVEFQSAAEADLIGAWLQVADDRGVDSADAYIAKLRDLCELIASQPEMGIARSDVAIDVRSFPVDNYVIYYEKHDSSVRILRVWHTAQDPVSFAID
jgi:toxin ParE1/3/4